MQHLMSNLNLQSVLITRFSIVMKIGYKHLHWVNTPQKALDNSEQILLGK